MGEFNLARISVNFRLFFKPDFKIKFTGIIYLYKALNISKTLTNLNLDIKTDQKSNLLLLYTADIKNLHKKYIKYTCMDQIMKRKGCTL